jgi:hypothetical protein
MIFKNLVKFYEPPLWWVHFRVGTWVEFCVDSKVQLWKWCGIITQMINNTAHIKDKHSLSEVSSGLVKNIADDLI